ncbi:MAG TPA: hypothetical protein VGS06_14540 [Streptosporangiaceae bacterium]|nr:hypothetical protein [Streptosporangiaceae bacterium]
MTTFRPVRRAASPHQGHPGARRGLRLLAYPQVTGRVESRCSHPISSSRSQFFFYPERSVVRAPGHPKNE